MTRVRKIGLSVMALLCVLTLGFALSACGGKDAGPAYGYGEEGTYYRDTGEGECLLILREGTFVFTAPDGTDAAGTYEHGEGLVTLVFDGGGKVEGTPSPDALTLAGPSGTVTFLRRRYYRVVFVDGGETLSEQSVLNGKAATDPGEPEREGCVFVGWYADEDFTERYAFDAAVTDNTVVFARFVELTGTTEYKITYDYTGETTETINGVVYNLPTPEREGYTFLGWWVSATNSADDLTYRYTDETLYEDTTLFAFFVEDGASYVGASVYDDKVTWENYSAAVTDIVLRDEEGTEVDRFSIQSTDQSYSYDFASLPSGKYTLVIQGGGIDEAVVYVSNGLSRASGFTVISGSILMYSAVDNAERYYISIECGNPSHDHTYIDNGTSLYYDFSSCEMPAEGITFTVYAEANGYVTSVSSPFNYFLGLDMATVTVENVEVTWERVALAQEYEVYINGELVATTSDTSYSLSSYGTGTYEVSVRPVTTGYYSEKSEIVTFIKTTLASPEITGIEDYTVTWTPVEGATGYTVSINGTETTIDGGDMTSLILSGDNYTEGLDEYEISVKALAEDSANDSPYGESVTVTGTSVGSAVSYNNGTVTWQYSLSASEYRITVNDGDETVVTGTNSTSITLTKSGNNEITIYFVDSDDNVYGTASITVYAYAIVFDARGGTAYMDGEAVDTIYVAKGDTVTLPDADRGVIKADFLGWYTLPDMTDDPDATEYQGDGVIFEDGTVFTGNTTIVLYACFLNPRLLVSLDPGMGTLYDGDGNEIADTYISLNGRSYTIAVPETPDAAYVFYGWYSGENGTGTRYTDEMGEAFAPFSDESVTILYAYWVQVLNITSASYNNTSGVDNVFSVSKGPDIGLVSEVTIPESYTVNGVEYKQGIIIGSAFASLTTLKTMNIPDTIVYIQMSGNGYDAGTDTFSGTALENVNVYATGEPSTTREVIYYSDGGVLFDLNSLTGGVELLYYPYGRTDETYEIPETVSNEYEYELDGTRQVPVVRNVNAIGQSVFRGHTEITYMVIPEYITAVGTYLFCDCTSLTYVEFAGEVVKMEDYMFQGCASLTEFDIPYTVSEIGDGVFRECAGLETFTVPENVETMGTYVFYGCTSLKTVYLPSTLGRIDDYTFYGCEALTGIDISYGVEEIGAYTFSGCVSVTGMTLPDSVTTIGDRAFYGCTSLREIELSQGLASLGTYVFANCSSLTGIVLPEGLTAIGQYDFNHCYSLMSVTLPESLKTIDKCAFQYCCGLTSVVIPRNVALIDTNAFFGCYKLVEVYNLSSLTITTEKTDNGRVAQYANVVHTSLDEDSIVIRNGGFLFMEEGRGYTLLGYEGTNPDPVVPAEYAGEVYGVADYAFYGNTVMESFVLPDGITGIGEHAFAECTSLRQVTLPASLREIPTFCFNDCPSLVSVVIPDSVTTVDTYAFYDCASLVSVTVGRGVMSVGNYAFTGCIRLAEVINLSRYITVTAGSPDHGGIAQYAKNVATSEEDSSLRYEGGFLSVCDADGNRYLIGYYGTETDLVLPDYIDGHVYEISDYAFDGCLSLTSVRLGAGVIGIGCYAFRGCTGLTAVSSDPGLTAIGDYAFYGCSSAETLILGSSLASIGDYCFCECSGLETAVFSAGPGTIGDYAFYGCSGLESIEIPDGVETIGDYAFCGCSSAETLILGPSLETIGKYAFYGCSSAETLILGSSLETIGKYAFYGCSSVTGVIFPGGLESIGDYAFYGCTSLAGISFTDAPASVGRYAFKETAYYDDPSNRDGGALYIDAVLIDVDSSCSGVLAVRDGTTVIAGYACYGLSGITGVILPDTVRSIGEWAFYNCKYMTSINIPEGCCFFGEGAFYSCSKLAVDVVLAGEELTIGTDAFRSSGITSVKASFAHADIGDNAFRSCSSLETADFGGTDVLDMGGSVFRGCSALASVTLSGCVASMGTYTFYNCSSLESVTVPDGVASIPGYTFYGCKKLREVSLPDACTGIEDYAFYNCSSLESLVIPAGVTFVGSNAFNGCSALTSVYYGGTSSFDWDKISIDSDNSPLTSATVYYYSETPSGSGNRWHWDDEGNPVAW